MSNNLTDSEVKKTLEQKIKFQEFDESEDAIIKVNILKNALDLINRLEEESIEKDRIIGLAEKAVASMKKQIEKLVAEKHIAKAEAYKECIEKVKPIICEIVDRMFNDNESNCVIHDCVKPSKIACNSEICIQENKQAWEGRIDNLLNELVGDDNE